jgi:hypothetical protein
VLENYTYDLAFVFPYRGIRKYPEIIFTVDERNLQEILDRLQILTSRVKQGTDFYLGKDNQEFTLPLPDLFSTNYRLSMVPRLFEKLPAEKRARYDNLAKNYLMESET